MRSYASGGDGVYMSALIGVDGEYMLHSVDGD